MAGQVYVPLADAGAFEDAMKPRRSRSRASTR